MTRSEARTGRIVSAKARIANEHEDRPAQAPALERVAGLEKAEPIRARPQSPTPMASQRGSMAGPMAPSVLAATFWSARAQEAAQATRESAGRRSFAGRGGRARSDLAGARGSSTGMSFPSRPAHVPSIWPRLVVPYSSPALARSARLRSSCKLGSGPRPNPAAKLADTQRAMSVRGLPYVASPCLTGSFR